MIRSMTGYGRGDAADGQRSATAEIRAVNHRYCEVLVKTQGKFAFAEEAVRSAVKGAARRGKIDVSVILTGAADEDSLVALNTSAAKQYCDSLRELQKQFGVTGAVSLELLASMPDVLKQGRPQIDEDAILRVILGAVEEALAGFESMRAAEGASLAEDLLRRLGELEAALKQIAERAPEVPRIFAAKLKERIAALTEKPVDADMLEQRLALEIAVFADRASIDEELVRFASHIDQFRRILSDEKNTEPVGKKLDFITQEMNREANTIGSKANDLLVTDLMIALKSGVENVREQVQNIC